MTHYLDLKFKISFLCSTLVDKVAATQGLYSGLRHIIIVEGQPAAGTLSWDQFVASTSGPLPLQEAVDIHKVRAKTTKLGCISVVQPKSLIKFTEYRSYDYHIVFGN